MAARRRPSCSRALALCLATGLGGCAHATIPGTQIADTEANREVYEVLVALREGFERRDAQAVLGLISPLYFEDNGTADPRDDYGYAELRERLLQEGMEAAKEAYLTLELHDVVIDGGRAHADVRYASRARLELPAGRLWDTHRDFDRIEMVRDGDAWRIVSGL